MDAFGMGLVAAMGALATVAGASEDIDSDIGSQSNPNSQVQLAAQVGNPHRIYNKAIAGEPPSNALWCTTAAIMAYVLIEGYHMPLLFAAAAGASLAALFDGVMSMSAYFRKECQPGQVQPVDLPGHHKVHDAFHHGTCMDYIVLYSIDFYNTSLCSNASSSLPDSRHRPGLGSDRRCYRIVRG